jgi:hypothetical protein
VKRETIKREYIKGWFFFDFISSTPSSWVNFVFHIINDTPAGDFDSKDVPTGFLIGLILS